MLLVLIRQHIALVLLSQKYKENTYVKTCNNTDLYDFTLAFWKIVTELITSVT